MAGLAKLGDKVRSTRGAKNANHTKRQSKSKETMYERAVRLKKDMPWPFDTLIDLSQMSKTLTKKGD